MPEQGRPEGAQDSDGVRWLAMLLRQVCLFVAGAIERRYGLKRRSGCSDSRAIDLREMT